MCFFNLSVCLYVYVCLCVNVIYVYVLFINISILILTMDNKKEIVFFKMLIKKHNLPKTLTKIELKKKAIIEGLTPSTFNNYFFVIDAFELILYDKANDFVTFENKFYDEALNYEID